MPDGSPVTITQTWEAYFEERTSNGAGEQAVALMQLAISALPEAERLYLLTAKPTLLHWGCGFGEGVGAISRIFPDVRVSGLDLAVAATDRARANYPDLEFLPSPQGHIPREFDVIIASERLAHFSQPLEVAAEHLASCRLFYAIVVPFNEWPLEPAHRSQFRDESFPPRIGHFRRIHLARIQPDPAVSKQEQILALYASQEYLAMRTHWDAAATEQRKWTEYYQSLDQDEPAEVAQFGEEFRSYIDGLLPEGGRVLEAGCGAGWQSLALARSGRYQIDLMDFAPAALDAARRVFQSAGLEAGFTLGDAFSEGLPEYDLVFNAGVVEHYSVERQGQLLRAMGSRSKKYVICLAPNRNCYWYWISRVRSAAEGQWPFGKESPLIDFRDAFEAAGLNYEGQAYLGRDWTTSFIRNLPGLTDDLRKIVLESHASPLISPEQGCYIVAGVGTVAAGRAERDAPAATHVTTVAELTAALSDALARSIATDAELRKSRAQTAQAEATSHEAKAVLSRLSAEIASLRGSSAVREDGISESGVLSAEITPIRDIIAARDARISELTKLSAEIAPLRDIIAAREARISELTKLSDDAAPIIAAREMQLAQLRERLAGLEKQLQQTVSALAGVERGLLASTAEIDHARRDAAEAKAWVAAMYAAAARYSEVMEHALETYRSQRAWKIMLAFRQAYVMTVREGWRGRTRLLFGPRPPLEDFELRFPRLQDYLPAPPLEVPAEEPSSVDPAIAVNQPPPCRYDVIILAIIDFDFRFQRPQQLAAQFARNGHRVFWVSANRVLPPNSTEPYHMLPLRENIWDVHLRAPQCDLYLGALTDDAAREFHSSLECLYRDWAVAETAIVVQLPFWRRLALKLRHEPSSVIVYDCMDDWDTFENLGNFNRTEEVPLAEECDVLAVTAARLQEKFADRGLEPVLVRNGADFEFFRTAEPLPELSGMRHPIIGYFGAIADWIDLDLVYEVAKSRPDYSFVLAGQVFSRDTSALQSLPNVRLLGSRPYEQMPSLLAGFDVCMIPFLLNQVTHATDPVKLYEYLSQGKPVVATDMSELRAWSDFVYLARGSEEFAAQLDVAVAESDPALRARRIEFARTNSWPARVADLDKAIADEFPTVSILIVTYNSAEFIGPCLRAVCEYTSYPAIEIIVVDNDSTDESASIAESFGNRDSRIRVVRHAANRGFAGGNNAAAALASGEYVVFLNADALVSPGWLAYLLRHVILDRSIGLICPVTNFAGNEAKINVDYTDEAGMRRFAMRIARENRGAVLDIAVAPLFCGLMRRDLLQEIGGLDEGYKIGMFEDDDLAAAVVERGFRICVAEDCFVHHFGQGSFSKLTSKEYDRLFEMNRHRFEEKWKKKWICHKTRPNVRPPHEEARFAPAQFCDHEPDPAKTASTTS